MKKTNVEKTEFKQIFNIITARRLRASRAVNNEVLSSAWEVGSFVSARLKTAEWGSKTVTQLSEYLRTQDPALRGYSRANIYNMVAFHDSYSSLDFLDYVAKLNLNRIQEQIALSEIKQNNGGKIVQSGTGQNDLNDNGKIVQLETGQFENGQMMPSFLSMTTFTNHIEILSRCKTIEERIFYILYASRERLNSKELRRCIQTNAFAALMDSRRSLSKGLMSVYPASPMFFKDEVFVDFLALPAKHSERKLKSGIIDNMKFFILELGKDFVFIDSEYPLNVSGSVFKIDLLFFHRGLQCLVAVELKADDFNPRDIGQLEFYLEALDRDVKHSNENPSIGILLCRSANKSVVEYAMKRSMSPTMVAEYKRQLISKETLRKSLDEFATFFD